MAKLFNYSNETRRLPLGVERTRAMARERAAKYHKERKTKQLEIAPQVEQPPMPIPSIEPRIPTPIPIPPIEHLVENNDLQHNEIINYDLNLKPTNISNRHI